MVLAVTLIAFGGPIGEASLSRLCLLTATLSKVLLQFIERRAGGLLAFNLRIAAVGS